MVEDYLRYLKASGYRPNTIRRAKSTLNQFKADFIKATQDNVLEFITDEKLKPVTLKGRYNILKKFYSWLETQGKILESPMMNLNPIKVPKLLPSRIMTVGETKKLMESLKLDVNNPLEYRDRVMCELAYNSSLRRSEVVGLNLKDFEPVNKLLRIRKSKTHRERLVPVGSYCCGLLEKYIADIRISSDSEALFTGRWGKRLGVHHLTLLVAKQRKKIAIRTKPCSHSFRSSSSTHLLKNKVPLRTVQGLLGHKSILSTQYYTKITGMDVFEMHRKYHPREREKRIEYPFLAINCR